jgi:biotin transport system substrate-specific component
MNIVYEPLLAQHLWPANRGNDITRSIILVLLGSALLTISAKVQVPFYPVPMTLQPLVVLLIGATLGARLGVLSVLLYLAEGLVGLPVFAGTPEKGLGLSYVLGPTGGYLIGFVLAAGIAGRLAEYGWDRNVFTTFAAMILATLAIYIPGLLWLGGLIGWDKPVLELGLYLFIIGDITKAVLAAIILPGTWQLLGKIKK